jgi:hypothetical protein
LVYFDFVLRFTERSLKDAKRRVVQSMYETVGTSERTVDESFNTHYAKYSNMMEDLRECKNVSSFFVFLLNIRGLSVPFVASFL